MLRKRLPIALMVSLIFLVPLCSAASQETSADTKETWIARLSALRADVSGRQTMEKFYALDPELVYSVVHDGWTRVSDLNIRSDIVNFFLRGYTPFGGMRRSVLLNPHALDIIALVMTEPATMGKDQPDRRNYLRDQVLRELRGIALRDIGSLEEFKAWRDSTGGKPLAAIVRENCATVVRSLQAGNADQRLKILDVLHSLDYYNGISSSSSPTGTTRTHTADGLTAVRRKRSLPPVCRMPSETCLSPTIRWRCDAPASTSCPGSCPTAALSPKMRTTSSASCRPSWTRRSILALSVLNRANRITLPSC